MDSSVNRAVPTPSPRDSCQNVLGVKCHDPTPGIDLEVFNIEDAKDAQIVIAAEEVSQAVRIMEEIQNPAHATSNVKVQRHVVRGRECSLGPGDSVEAVTVHRRAVQENPKVCRKADSSGLSENDTLPLAVQSANEKAGAVGPPLPWVSTYDKVEELVREYEIETTSKFLLGNPDRDFGKTFDETKHHHHVHLDGGGFGNDLTPKLCLDGLPYFMMGNRRLACHHGKPHPQSSKKIKGKQRLCVQASKKVGCPAHIFIRHVILLPDFSFDKNKMTAHRRRELSKHIKATWKKQHTITTESRFYIEFPDVSSHKNHPLGEAAGVKQPIDKRVNDKMLQLISDGMKSVPLIETSIREFVRSELFRDSPCPPDSNRRFYPTQKDITNRIFKVAASSHSSKLKTDELEESVRAWLTERRVEGGFGFFRNAAYSRKDVNEQSGAADSQSTSNSELGKEQTEKDSQRNGNADWEPLPDPTPEGLLFVYQTQHQRRLLERYGCHLTCLDSAHREADYPIPLYFLLVNTNCGFYVAAVVAMAKESAEDLREALGRIREANPCWKPRQFMVEPAEVEIQIVKGLFPDCRVFITDARRQQAWQRFLKRKHCTSKHWQELLADMTSVATARTTEAHQAALDRLRRAWTKPGLKQMRAWFRDKWMTNIRKWAHVYRQPEQLLPLIANKGLESQRGALGYPFVASNRHRMLHEMLDLVIGEVLPEMETRYLEANNAWKIARDSILPSLLRNRPQSFIDHCRQRLPLAKRIQKTSITRLDRTVCRFLAGDPDGGGGSQEIADLGAPSCTCEEFVGTGYPCVHLLACIVDGDDVVWARLPSAYLDSPFLTIDGCGEVGGTVDDAAVGDEGRTVRRALGEAEGVAEGVASGEEQVHEDVECAVAVAGISAEVKATSNWGAILAAVEAHQMLEDSTNPSSNSSPMQDDPFPDEAARCRAVARELFDLTHAVADAETLAQARVQMEAVLTTLKQALHRGELHDSACHDQTTTEVVMRASGVQLDQDFRPAIKRRRLEEQVQISSNDRLVDTSMEVDITGDERTEVYVDQQNLEVDETVVTETIDLQQGAVFILETSGMMRNVQIIDDSSMGTVIIKDS